MQPPPIDPALSIARVELAVSDLARSVDFYERLLGLPLAWREPSDEGASAALGPDGERPLLRLRALAGAIPAPRGSTGLFHVAILHPSRRALAESVLRLALGGWPLDGASDHGVSEAIYLADPDGLGIELYVDRPRERWARPADGHGVQMYTAPLDVDDLLAEAPDTEPAPVVTAGTTIGHVHLKVADVPRAAAFYRDALGFEEQARIPSAAFLAAGGYHHHVGLNSWQSHGGAPAPDTAPGLRLVEFELSSTTELDALQRRLAAAADRDDATRTHREDGRLSLRDPDGAPLAFALAAPAPTPPEATMPSGASAQPGRR